MIKTHGELKSGTNYFFYTIAIMVKKKNRIPTKKNTFFYSIEGCALGLVLLGLSGSNPIQFPPFSQLPLIGTGLRRAPRRRAP